MNASNNQGGRAQQIATVLRAELQAQHVRVDDESHLHAGHAGARESGGGHFRATVAAECFTGLSRVAAQRMVFAALHKGGLRVGREIHALALALYTPEQWAKRGAAGQT